MARRPDPEEDDDIEETPSSSSPSLLKQILHYAMLGFAPLVAVVALAIAVVAVTGNRVLQAQLDTADAKIKKLGTELTASQRALRKIWGVMQHETAAQEAEQKKQDELTAKVIQNLTPLQTKLKIHPTLEEQLRQAASASAVPPTGTNAASAPVAATPAPAPAPKKVEKPHSPEVKAMLNAIKKFNEQ